MTTTENKRIDLDQGAGEALAEAYRVKIRDELLSRYPQILEEQDELLKKLLQDEYIKNRFIEILTEEGVKELKEVTQIKATLKNKGGSDEIW
jgi:pyruvate/2-oxoglutarate dehydrogenase complex dihydrolipoamide dehydrogenase (E3) component